MSNILLGTGVFSIGGVDIGLTKGGGKFTVERSYKMIEADGDMGPVKGRISKEKSIAKLLVNAISLLPANFPKMYPATKIVTVTGTDTITANEDIQEQDYQSTLTWTGKTKAGRPVKITLENAINLENIDWGLVSKEEVIAALTYTATYLETNRTTEPWKIEYLPTT